MIRHYDSIVALRDHFIALGCLKRVSGHDNDWYGGETPADSVHLATTGDTSLVPEAEKLIDQLDTQIETPRRVWEPSPAGSFCVVPDVLAGLPTPMRRQREIGDEHHPIAIFVCSTISGAISTSLIQKRGTTILALVLALARVRPVSLCTVATIGGERGDRIETVLSTRIETAPLHLASACWALTSPGFARRLNYDIARKINGFEGGWPELYNTLGQARYCDHLGEVLSPTSKDRTLVIAPAHIRDPLINAPVAWLNQQIHHFLGEQEDAI